MKFDFYPIIKLKYYHTKIAFKISKPTQINRQ